MEDAHRVPQLIRIALDALGGDAGPQVNIEGAAKLSREENGPKILLFGPLDLLRRTLSGLPHDPSRLELHAASGVVPMAADPADALEALPDASIRRAAEAVARGEADALVSAGHTGATILSASRAFSRLPGIRRAALAAVYPTEARHGPRGDPFALILDVGATLGATAEDLCGFAVMGSVYASIVSENPSPRVALLSNGSEANRGTPAIIEAHQRLRESRVVDFVGNVEGIDIAKGSVDVVVCDGFLGNVVLKMLEGVSDVLTGLLKEARDENLLWRLGLSLVGHDIRQIRAMTDWKQYGGAPLLGFDKVVIKAHGRSNARAVRNALKVASKAVERDLVGRIRVGCGGGKRG